MKWIIAILASLVFNPEKDMKLYKYRSFNTPDFIEDILDKKRLFCPPYFSLNDPFEGQFLLASSFAIDGSMQKPIRAITPTSIDNLIDPESYFTVRVCSLSSSLDDVRMWSLYAGSHTGIAIEIETDGMTQAPYKVDYNSSLFLFDKPQYAGPSIIQALSSKTDHWRYESEYRFITTEEYISIDGHIQRVILGPRFNHKKATFGEKLKSYGVPLVQAHLDAHTTKIVLDE